jgi:hypothetical protein
MYVLTSHKRTPTTISTTTISINGMLQVTQKMKSATSGPLGPCHPEPVECHPEPVECHPEPVEG